MRFRQLVANHRWAIILAFVASIIVASPQVLFRIDHAHDGVYQGIELLPDAPWSPRVREVMDGHGFGSVYYKDGKDNPYLFQPLGSMTVAYMGKAFGLDINNTFLLSRVLLTFIVFLLIYGFVFLISRDKLAALVGASVFLLADAALSLSGLKQVLHGVPANFLPIDFPVNPAMIYALLFGFLISFWLFYQRRDWRFGVLSAILLGLNFYNYFYSWTYLYAFGGLVVLWYLVRRDWKESLRIGSVFAGALLVAIPYFINLYHASQYPTYADVGMRLGIIGTHAPFFVGMLVILALVVFWFGFPREDGKRRIFGFALLLAPFITMNQQLLTGKEMQAAHYHWYFHKPIAILLVVVTLFYLISKMKVGWYRRALAVLMIAASFALGTFTQVASYAYGKADGGSVLIERQKYGPVMAWLNQNAENEAVVLADDPISYAVTVYTPLNVFYHRAAMLTLPATEERLLDTLFTFYRLRGVGKSDARSVFYAEREYISANIYGIYYRQFAGSYDAIPDEKLDYFIARYQATLDAPAAQWLKQKLEQYEVNYVVWDKKADPDWQLQKYPFFKEAAILGDIVIYRVTL